MELVLSKSACDVINMYAAIACDSAWSHGGLLFS